MSFDFQEVSLSEIDTAEETYRISIPRNSEALAASIAEVGLINPPILVNRGGHYGIVSGFRRVGAICLLGRPTLWGRILSVDTPHFNCVRLAVTENTSQRGLNPIEISRALALLSTCFTDETALSHAAGPLGLPNSLSLIRRLLPLCRLPREVQQGIIGDTIGLPVAQMLEHLGPETAIWFANLFQTLKISLNKQREIITLSQEIGLREDLSILSVFEESPLRDILNDPDADRSRKATALRSHLKQRRYPTITRTKEAFEGIIRSLKLDLSAKLIPPADFEGTVYSLSLSFSKLSELHDHRKTIDRILTHPEIARLLLSAE